jgi:DNA-binding MarR family transcriptional regulator
VKIVTSPFAADDDTKRRLRDLARHILDERERRQWYFPRALFDEIPWEMLLVLYGTETSRLSSDSLCHSVLAQPTTGNRWIDYLASADLVTRHVEPSDRSRSIVELAPKGLELLERYLSDRLEREAQTTQPDRLFHSKRSAASVAILVPAIAALSAAITYLLTSFGVVRLLDWVEP